MRPVELIDTHAHLYLEEFSGDLEPTINRAVAEGVSRIYLPAIDSGHHHRMFALEQQYPNRCFAMVGVHPCYIKAGYREELEKVSDLLTKRKFAAVGEIGLDYYWDTSFVREQRIAFEQQMEMAATYKLPVVIHSRNAMDDTIDMLKAATGAGLRGIFHCFSGSRQNAEDIIACGMYLGIGGVITYKNAGLAEVVADLPLESLVLETDAPYLSPVPFRGKRNESSYLRYIVAKLAEVKGLPVEQVAEATTANARKIFGAQQ